MLLRPQLIFKRFNSTLPEKILNGLPKGIQPYARLSRIEKPVGTWLLYSPCTWSITLAATATGAPLSTTAWYLALFGIGSFLTRGAGCTINDIWDRHLDARVERTKTRPLAARDVSVPQAVGWLGLQGTAALAVLFSLPPTCWSLTAASIIPLLVYPLFKRFTNYPQAWLAIWFSYGAFLGFPAMGLQNYWAMFSMLGSAASWCMIYDTIYGHQDKKFDMQVGMKSTAIKWADRTLPIARRFFFAQYSLLAASTIFAGGVGPGILVGGTFAAIRQWNMMSKVNIDDPNTCGNFFLKNVLNGHIITVGFFVDYILKLLGYL